MARSGALGGMSTYSRSVGKHDVDGKGASFFKRTVSCPIQTYCIVPDTVLDALDAVTQAVHEEPLKPLQSVE